MKIYVVMGVTGEYSDRNEWPVCAFSDEKMAQERVEKATFRAAEIRIQKDAGRAAGGNWYEAEKALLQTNEFDPDMEMDYTGTSYFLYTVDLMESV
jgi:hypothetical protein